MHTQVDTLPHGSHREQTTASDSTATRSQEEAWFPATPKFGANGACQFVRQELMVGCPPRKGGSQPTAIVFAAGVGTTRNRPLLLPLFLQVLSCAPRGFWFLRICPSSTPRRRLHKDGPNLFSLFGCAALTALVHAKQGGEAQLPRLGSREFSPPTFPGQPFLQVYGHSRRMAILAARRAPAGGAFLLTQQVHLCHKVGCVCHPSMCVPNRAKDKDKFGKSSLSCRVRTCLLSLHSLTIPPCCLRPQSVFRLVGFVTFPCAGWTHLGRVCRRCKRQRLSLYRWDERTKKDVQKNTRGSTFRGRGMTEVVAS